MREDILRMRETRFGTLKIPVPAQKVSVPAQKIPSPAPNKE
jgi:hypothetical protein